MAKYRHQVTGFFGDRHDAQNALSSLVELGLPRDRLQIFKTDSNTPETASKEGSHAVLKVVLVDGAIGTGLDALAGVANTAKGCHQQLADRFGGTDAHRAGNQHRAGVPPVVGGRI